MTPLPPCDHEGCPKARCVQNDPATNLRAIALRGPKNFTAEPKETAFAAWWNANRVARKGWTKKVLAMKAFDAALREMGCFDD